MAEVIMLTITMMMIEEVGSGSNHDDDGIAGYND